MGKIEEILNAMEPLKGHFYRDTVTINIADNSVDVLRYEQNHTRLSILFRIDKDWKISIFFILRTVPELMIRRDDQAKIDYSVVFSCRSVFELLDINDAYEPTGTIKDLSTVSELIMNNLYRLSQAFSEENVVKTYHALMVVEGEYQDEYNVMRKGVINRAD